LRCIYEFGACSARIPEPASPVEADHPRERHGRYSDAISL